MINREIKFRGFDNENKQWVYGYYTKLPDGATKFDYIISDIDGSLTKFYIEDIKTIGQYTGLKDKNGKEIYEGDIVKSSIHDKLWVVEYRTDTEYVGFVLKEIGEDYISTFTSWRDVEVIGNIYENPELLKINK